MSLGQPIDVTFNPRRRWYEDQRPLVYVVLDVKTDGGNPKRNAIRSVGAVALDQLGRDIGRFVINIAPPEGTNADARTMQRYRNHGEAWQIITANAERPAQAIASFIDWVTALPGQAVAVGMPLSFTAIWLDHYLRRYSKHVFFRGHSEGVALFAGGSIDLPSFVMGITGMEYRAVVEHLLPAAWRGGRVETHRSREDSLMHAELMATMLRMRSGEV